MAYLVFLLVMIICIIALSLFTSDRSSSKTKDDSSPSRYTEARRIFEDSAGAEGEWEVSMTASARLPGYKVIRNLYVPQGGERVTEVDMVLVHNSGIYVLEVKNYSGWIFGSETQRYWTKVHYKEKHQFYNPLMQNRGHINSLQRYLGLDPSLFHSYVVFTGDCEFRSLEYNPAFHKVVKRERLAGQIKEDANEYGTLLTDDQVSSVYAKLLPLTNPSMERREEQVRTYREAKSKGEATGTRCPLCGGTLVLRTARATGQRFWGCSNYPACKYTRKYTGENQQRPRSYQ